MVIKLPDKVKYILQKLYDDNYDAYVVGGCVRDSLLQREPGDWDITTNALPEDIRSIFGYKDTVPTGIKYGTVTVLLDRESFEVTTYRVDLGYSDGRRPDEVRFTPSLEEELERRDFTINAMAYNEKMGLVDLFGGRDDLQKGIIRCVGNPDERFNEDALRMMRAVRFAAQLGFDIEDVTLESIQRSSALLRKISMERINVELSKTISSDNPSKAVMLFSLGLFAYIIPEAMDIYKCRDGENILDMALRVIERVEPVVYIRIAVLLHEMLPGCDVQIVSGILRRLKYDSSTIGKACSIIRFYDSIFTDKPSIKKCLNIIGVDLFMDILKIRSTYVEVGSSGSIRYISELENVKKALDEILKNDECYTKRRLAVDGRDLINLGLSGTQIGEALNYLLDIVIYNPCINVKEILLDKVRKLNKGQPGRI